MMIRFASLFALTATTAMAEPPKVATDIAPVHALVAGVTGDLGTPSVLIEGTGDPHQLTMRPSHARAISQAGLVVWVGPDLTPWLSDWISDLAPDTPQLALMGLDGTHVLPIAELRDAHDEHADEHHGEDHEEEHHDHHEEEHSGEHEEDEQHGHEHGGEHHEDEHHGDEKVTEHTGAHEGHDHGTEDPHVWLDPENAAFWSGAIATKLAELDPVNATVYAENSAAQVQAIQAAEKQVAEILAPMKGQAIIAGHDSWAYFEEAFDLEIVGFFSDVEGEAPGPRHLAELQEIIADHNVRCVLAEVGQNEGQIRSIFEGQEVKIVQLSPLGASLSDKDAGYAAILTGIATEIASCMQG